LKTEFDKNKLKCWRMKLKEKTQLGKGLKNK
jgi:hypothetical protein